MEVKAPEVLAVPAAELLPRLKIWNRARCECADCGVHAFMRPAAGPPKVCRNCGSDDLRPLPES